MTDKINPRYVEGEPVCSGMYCPYCQKDVGEDWEWCGKTGLVIAEANGCFPAVYLQRDRAEARVKKLEAQLERVREWDWENIEYRVIVGIAAASRAEDEDEETRKVLFVVLNAIRSVRAILAATEGYND